MVVPKETVDKAKNTLKLLGVSALIVVGGDGSLTTALQLWHDGVPVIGVPRRSTTTSVPPP
jgi:6-phosphofructokinase 1